MSEPVPGLPVDSLREAATHLRRPFTAEAVKWKVQAGSLVVPYIDARLVIERLNLVCPHLWHDEFEPLGKSLICHLTVDGITRHDVGSGYEGKGLYSDALKRAAVKFGVGVSLYALPKVFLDKGKGQLKERTYKGKTIVEITDKGLADLDKGYAKWLTEVGEDRFGEVLDHGDVHGAIGDVEAQEPATDAPAEEEPKPVDTATAKALIERACGLYEQLDPKPKNLLPAAFDRQLKGAKESEEKLTAFVQKLEARVGEKG